MCPNELNCGANGNKAIVPPLNGEVITTAINKWEIDKLFVLGDVCSYIIQNPDKMGPRAWMWLDITGIENVDVWVSKTNDYLYDNRFPTKIESSKRIGMLRGK